MYNYHLDILGTVMSLLRLAPAQGREGTTHHHNAQIPHRQQREFLIFYFAHEFKWELRKLTWQTVWVHGTEEFLSIENLFQG